MAANAKDIQFKELKDTISQLNTTIRIHNNMIASAADAGRCIASSEGTAFAISSLPK